ncbi:MAG: hypothetical protein RLP14_02300 [Owenweeksia sp.]
MKPNLKTVIALPLCLIINSFVFAQSETDYILSLTGDTTYTQFKEWPRVYPPEVLETVSGKSYRPGDISGFVRNGVLYYSKKAVIETTEQTYQLRMDNKKLFNIEPSFDTICVFMTVIVKGPANLMEWRYPSFKTIYFFGDSDTTLELRMTKRYRLENQQEVTASIRYNRLYLNQLSYIMRDCDKVLVRENLNYDKRALKKLFERYNSCKSPGYKNTAGRREKGWFAGLRAGLTISSIDYVHKDLIFAQPDYQPSFTPQYEIYARFPGFLKGFSSEFNIAYISIETNGTFTDDPFWYEDTYHAEIAFKSVQGGLNIYYHYELSSDFIPFGMLGGSVGFLNSGTNLINRTRYNSSTNETTYIEGFKKDEYTITDMIFNLSMGAGVQWKRWALGYRFVFPGDYIRHSEMKESIKQHIITLSYDIISKNPG